MAFHVLALLGRIFGVLPRAWIVAGGRAFGVFVGFALRIRLRQVRTALRETDVSASAWEVYARLGARTFLLLRAWARPADPCVVIPPAALARFPKGPFVLAGTHTGAWELAAFALGRTGRAVACMVHPPSNASVRTFLTELRRRGAIREIVPQGALSRAARELAQGNVVVCVADQVPAAKKHAVRGTFLGRPAWLDRTAAVLATRAKVPLVVCGVSGPPGHEIVDILEVFSSADGLSVASLTARIHQAIDAFVRSRPEDWLWLHRRWRDPLESPRHGAALSLELSAREG